MSNSVTSITHSLLVRQRILHTKSQTIGFDYQILELQLNDYFYIHHTLMLQYAFLKVLILVISCSEKTDL
jgi:hypothetical protein